jgi:hypothetical protein
VSETTEQPRKYACEAKVRALFRQFSSDFAKEQEHLIRAGGVSPERAREFSEQILIKLMSLPLEKRQKGDRQ